MKFNNESAFTRFFCDQLERLGYTCLTLAGGSMAGSFSTQRPGLPDRYIFGPATPGRAGVPGIWIESKLDGGVLSGPQHRLMREMVDAGVPVAVLRAVHTANHYTIEVLRPTPGIDKFRVRLDRYASMEGPRTPLEVFAVLAAAWRAIHEVS